jgi:hypothetical protein
LGTATINNGDTSDRTFQVRIREQLSNTTLQSRVTTVTANSGTATVTFALAYSGVYVQSAYSFVVEAYQNAGTATSSSVSATLQQVVLA